MARTPAAKIGHNQPALPDQKDYRAALALFVRMEEEKKAMNERHKRLKKRLIEGKSIAVEDAQRMFKMKDAPLSDVTSWLRRQVHALGSIFGLAAQSDLFAADPAVLDAIRFRGLMAGLEGKDGVPPPTLDGNEKKAFMEGWHDGIDARKSVGDEMQKEFMDGDEEQDHSEAALRDRAAEKVGAQAAADFRADNAPPAPDWSTFPAEASKWTTSQQATFVAWYSSLPREADGHPVIPDGLPLAVREAFVTYRAKFNEPEPKAPVENPFLPADYRRRIEGAQGVGGEMVRLHPKDVKRLDLTPDDFSADDWDGVSAQTYGGFESFDDYHLVVVRDGDRIRVLKDVVGPPPVEAEGESFEAPEAELEAQKPRLAVVGSREASAEEEPAAEEPKAKATKPKAPPKAPAAKKESQSEKAARKAREAGIG